MTPIIAAPSAPHAVVDTNAVNVPCTDWYLRALVALWDAGLTTGVDPVVLAAQCALETGWGQFGGSVTEKYGNTCGMKNADATGDTPADLAHFAVGIGGYPWLGALAHAHHLRLYAGLPVPADSPDPRAGFVGPGSSRFGAAPYVEQLSMLWAPSTDYGFKIVGIMDRLRKAP
jgi:hypothetical protein